MKRTLSSIAAAALVLGTVAPAAFAQSTSNPYTDISGNFAEQQIIQLTNAGYIHGFSDGTYRPTDPLSRGQLLSYFLLSMESATGVKPVAEAQYFADVPPHNWAFNFVGAAEEAGWINPYWIGVRPGYNFNENYQASFGDAASFFVAAMEKAGMLTTAQMNGMAPLAWARANGLFQNIPNGNSTVYMTRADAAMFLTNAIAWTKGQLLPTGATVTVTGGTSMAPNTNEMLGVSVKDAQGNAITLPSTASVSYSTDSSNAAIVNGNELVVTAPGTVNVVATVDGIQSQPFTVTVYGPMAAVKLSAATTSPVANGVYSDAVTLTAVDANGNTVANYNGTATVTMSGSGVSFANGTNGTQASDAVLSTTSSTYSSSPTYNVTFTNGVGTINVISGTTPGLTSTLTATYTPANSTTTQTGTLNLTTVPQVATALKVTSEQKYVSANTPTNANFDVEVVDQTGNPMLSGTYPFNVSVTGPATYSGTSTGVFFANGSTSPTPATITATSEQGVTGTITVTASGSGLTSGSATTQAVIAQAPVKLQATSATGSNTFVQGPGNSLTYNLTAVDANGYPATWPSSDTFTVYVTNSSGGVASNVYVNGTGEPSSGAGVGLGTNQMITLTDPSTTTADAGNYTVTIKDQNGNVWASFPVVETGAAASKLSLSAASQYVSESNPSTTVSAQLTDTFGNPASLAGIPVTFTVSGNMVGGGTFTGGTNTITAYTNASGVATATLTMQPYVGEQYTINASANNSGATYTASPVNVTVEPTVATQVQVQMGQGSPTGPSYVTAGQTVSGYVYVKDQYGNPVSAPQSVTLSVTGGLNITDINGAAPSANTTGTASPYSATTVNGSVYFSGMATTAGAVTVQATDTSISPNVSGSGQVFVNAGTTMGGYAFFNANGQEITSSNELAAAANTPVEVWLKPVDPEGNPIVSNEAGIATFSDGGMGGQFRVNSSSAASQTSYAVPAGTVAIPVWYVNSATGTNGATPLYDLSTTSIMATGFPSSGATVTGTTYYSYSATVTGSAGATIDPSLITVPGYTLGTAPANMGYTVTAASGGGYTVTIYNSSNTLSTPPTVNYNGTAF